VQSHKDEAGAEGIQHVYGMTHTTRPYGFDGKFTLHIYKRSGVTVEIAVVDEIGDGETPLLEVALAVRRDEHPHLWRVVYEHSLGYILDGGEGYGLEECLRKYCPAPDEVLESGPTPACSST